MFTNYIKRRQKQNINNNLLIIHQNHNHTRQRKADEIFKRHCKMSTREIRSNRLHDLEKNRPINLANFQTTNRCMRTEFCMKHSQRISPLTKTNMYPTTTLASKTLFIAFLVTIVANCHGETSALDSHSGQEIIVKAQSETSRAAATDATSLAFGDLVAIGAISLVNSNNTFAATDRRQQQQSRSFDENSGGRLVDQIASSIQGEEFSRSQGRPAGNKLDYIIDFMRANRLTKFCDLLTNSESPIEIKQLVARLNNLNQFTLFVPTNEALLLMESSHQFKQRGSKSNSLERLKGEPEELKKFILAHVAGELIVPKLNLANVRETRMFYHWFDSSKNINQSAQLTSASSTNLARSLGGSVLRLTTAAYQSQWPASRNNLTSQLMLAKSGNGTRALTTATTSAASALKLELIVNGANVLNGHSHALQEPSDNNTTYAIVHLIDRSLYQQIPSQSVLDKIQAIAPKMFHYLQLMAEQQQAGDQTRFLNNQSLLGLLAELESSPKLFTLFLPNDEAFEATPKRLLDKLESNGTYLNQFIRNHLVEGLYYSGQLAPTNSFAQLRNDFNRAFSRVRLSSLSNVGLEFESKILQSRQLILLNSIPILESDIMALNGVVHLISRPIFNEPEELAPFSDECNCRPANKDERQQQQGQRELVAKLWPNFVNGQRQAAGTNLSSNDLGSGSMPDSSSNLFSSFGTNNNALGGPGELEREESDVRPALLRSQRSHNNLEVNKNNKNFYRPNIGGSQQAAQLARDDFSAAGSQARARLKQPADQLDLLRERTIEQTEPNPANSFLNLNGNSFNDRFANRSQLDQAQQVKAIRVPLFSPSQPAARSVVDNAQQLEPQLAQFVDENRYKIVLNATSRQKMRELQANQRLSRLEQQQQNSANLFAYDRPLPEAVGAASGESSARQRPYSSVEQQDINLTPGPASLDRLQAASSANVSSWLAHNSRDQIAALATSRQQRLLKFQPEDARDAPVMPGERLNQFGAANRSLELNAGSKARLESAQQLVGKTSAPPMFGGCAFYDTECKRLIGKLVRLPPSTNRSQANKQQQASSLIASAASNNTYSIATGTDQNLDSTFGEGTERAPNQLAPQQTPVRQQPAAKSSLGLTGPRLSALNQPLPPWSEEENRAGQLQQQHQSQWVSKSSFDGADIIRIAQPNLLRQPANSFNQQSTTTSSPQLVPADNFHRQLPPPPSRLNQQSAQRTSAQIILMPIKNPQQFFSNLTKQLDSANQAIYLNGPLNRPVQKSPGAIESGSSKIVFNSNQQFHTPTPFSVSLATTHMPPIFNQPNQPAAGRLTNFSTIETLPFEEPLVLNKNLKLQRQQQPTNRPQVPQSPSVLQRKQQQQQRLQQQAGNAAASDPNDFNAIKQARKIVRIQSGLVPASDQVNSDISVTSARLTNAKATSGAAINLSADQSVANANFVRSIPFAESEFDQTLGSPSSADFFQNRTISEIIDDSGLRIDGQQVTFSRLKDCLAEAELLSLVSQTGSSLTIFMPTDLAFQRLIQQQAALYSQKQANKPSTLSGRLIDPAKNHLLPLLAKSPAKAERIILSNGGDLLNNLSENQVSPPLNAIADRLTLDCSSAQVRQLLLDHLSPRLVLPKQLQSDMVIGSLSGHQLLLSSVPNKKIVVVDGQPVIAATRAKNGMVYVINKFLNLTQQMQNVIQLMESQPNLTTFVSYLNYTNLTDRLKRETGPLTILAPTNEAFEQLSGSARQLLNSDPAALMDVLRGHIVEGAQFGKLISLRSSLKTMNPDQMIEARVVKPNVYMLNNRMTSLKLLGTTANGVVNSIEELIVPSWLSISMGRPAVGAGSAGQPPRTNGSSSGANLFVGELENSSSGQGNNLQTIGDKLPIRFNRIEMAGDRLLMANSDKPLTNSFLLPNNESNFIGRTRGDNNDNNNNFFSFGETSPGADSTRATTPRSPFLKVAANLTGNNIFGTGNEQKLNSPNGSISVQNVTRNMLLIEKLANLMQTSKFVKYLLKSKVSQMLKPDMNYVLLIPIDQAVDKLPRQIINMLDGDEERLNDLIYYHVLDTTFEYINTIPDGQTLNTLNEKDILFNWHKNNTILTASGAVVMGGIQEDNIALLIVDRVLYPTRGDLLNIITNSPILSNFTSLIREAKLEAQLASAGPFTLFAPSDFAFNQLAKRDLELIRRDKETARRFLLKHLSQPAIFTSTIALSNQTSSSKQSTPSMVVSNSLGEDLTLRQRNDYFSANDINFSYADVAATNGVVHVIDGLL